MSTSALIKDLLPLGSARLPTAPRKVEQKADTGAFDRALDDSRRQTEPRDKPAALDKAQADAPRRPEEDRRHDADTHASNRPEQKDRPEHRDRPEPGAKSASDRGENPPGLVKQDKEPGSDAAAGTEEATGKRRGQAKSDDKPTEDSLAGEQTPPAVTGEPLLTAAPETTLTADLLAKLAAETVQPETAAAAVVAATQDQVTEAAKPADAAASATSTDAPAATAPETVAVPLPASPAPAVQAKTAETDQTLQAVGGEKTAQKAATTATTLPTPDAGKARDSGAEPAVPADEATQATAKPEIQQASQQTTSAAAKELARVVEQLAEPKTPVAGQPNTQISLQTTAAEALTSAKPQDPAHALARADSPVPLQAIAVEIGMRAMRGSKEFSIRLDPEDLGRIDIKLEISEAGQVQAKLVVERVETLQLLQRDAKTLERAFDQAGLKTNPDGLQFSLRDPGQQARQNGQQDDKSAFASKDKDSTVIDEIALRPAIYSTAIRGGLDIRI
jgi:flagellar hook-length control protein FliK